MEIVISYIRRNMKIIENSFIIKMMLNFNVKENIYIYYY